MKIIFPIVWIGGWGIGTLAMFLGVLEGTDEPLKWKFLLGWISGSALSYWSGIRLKAVSVDDNCLYVSN